MPEHEAEPCPVPPSEGHRSAVQTKLEGGAVALGAFDVRDDCGNTAAAEMTNGMRVDPIYQTGAPEGPA